MFVQNFIDMSVYVEKVYSWPIEQGFGADEGVGTAGRRVTICLA